MKRILLSTVITALFTLAGPARAQVETFSIDPEHSFANWEIRHVAALTSGTFHDVKGKIQLDTANLAKSSIEATISVYSLNSSHRRRDIHILTEEYLGARDYPEMKFVSTGMQPVNAERGTLTGMLTLHGVTKPVTLNYQILGLGNDPWGGMRAGFKATTRILRSDFGISKHLPSGPVGNEVDITLLIEGIKLGPDGQPWNAKKAEAEKSKVISYPMPGQPAPQVVPAQPAVTATQPAAQPAPAAPAATPAEPEKKESLEDQLKKKLKGLF
ncbi:MAG TPA: YceI family protein [Thiobacillaceae bacterium]|nr:YceI family protein [Thiobacillaceae bacterium]